MLKVRITKITRRFASSLLKLPYNFSLVFLRRVESFNQNNIKN